MHINSYMDLDIIITLNKVWETISNENLTNYFDVSRIPILVFDELKKDKDFMLFDEAEKINLDYITKLWKNLFTLEDN